MQVTHQQDFDTHAIIGGSEVMEFGIAETAEFFTVLFASLYSDKPLAVVREVLCNAWDAHIASGRTDTAVQVTIDDTKMVIRDFGFGIKHDMIRPIYLVAGNSTKAHDGKQTGGFGLGSKAPFAYSDHFTVSSHHVGTKTVYAMSRGSAKTDGKPDARVMVRVPTTETGLEVSVPLKNTVDAAMFQDLVRTIASLGEMKVMLNDKLIETVPISSGKEGWIITRKTFTKAQEKIYIRYGNVVYPVPDHEEYQGLYQTVKNFLDNLPNNHGYNDGWRIIFQAPANKISVTPSRESLSLTDTTIETIKELLAKLTPIGTHLFNKTAREHVENVIQDHWRTFEQYKMLMNGGLFRNKNPNETRDDIYSFSDAVLRILRHRYPSDTKFADMDMTTRLNSFIENKNQKSGVIKQYLHTMKKTDKLVYHHHKYAEWSKFSARYFTGPILKKVINSDKVDKKYLFVVAVPAQWSSSRPTYTPSHQFKGGQEAALEMLKNTIVVTHSRSAFMDDYKSMPLVKHVFGVNTHQLIYIAPRTKSGAKDAVEFFTKIGMNVIDHVAYAEKHAPAPEFKAAVKAAEPKKPKIVGIPSLVNLIAHQRFTPRGHMVDNPHRIETPEFVFQPHSLSGQSYTHRFFEFKDEVAPIIVRRFGHLGGICVNSRQLDKYIKEGAKDGYVWLGERMLDEFQTNPRIPKLVSFVLAPWQDRCPVGKTIKELFDVSAHSDAMRKEFKFPDALTEEDWDFVKLWEAVRPEKKGEYLYGRSIPNSMNPFIREIQKLLDAVTIDPQLTVIQDLVKNSDLFRLLDFSEMRRILASDKSTPKQKADVESLLLLALQG